jgi:hypothetical protein
MQNLFINNKDREILVKDISDRLPRLKDPDRLLLYHTDDFSDVPMDYRYAFLNYKKPTR